MWGVVYMEEPAICIWAVPSWKCPSKFRHTHGRCLNKQAYTSRTYFYHQSKFIFPTILLHWESYLSFLITSLTGIKEAVWCGDGIFDSMGHSAKFGAYTMFCTTIMKIVHFDLLQVFVAKSAAGYMQDIVK